MKCPICKKKPVEEWKPFCSKFCKDKDLLNWANGAYSIPASESEPFTDELTEDDEFQ